MRGKVSDKYGFAAGRGITPAHAGKSPRPAQSRPRGWDHPRACGEKKSAAATKRIIAGSPPRMRGKARAQTRAAAVKGITPAHAGKRGPGPCRRPCPEDHPRACGEKLNSTKLYRPLSGSPPRMRGKVGSDKQAVHALGITPAHAGKRRSFRCPASRRGDHPRACGERLRGGPLLPPPPGSPPRMRGKAGCTRLVRRLPGITPAHAGKGSRCPG